MTQKTACVDLQLHFEIVNFWYKKEFVNYLIEEMIAQHLETKKEDIKNYLAERAGGKVDVMVLRL